MPDQNWLTEGRERVRERIEGGDTEYEEYVKDEYPYLYWSWEWTGDPPEDVAEELGLDD